MPRLTSFSGCEMATGRVWWPTPVKGIITVVDELLVKGRIWREGTVKKNKLTNSQYAKTDIHYESRNHEDIVPPTWDRFQPPSYDSEAKRWDFQNEK